MRILQITDDIPAVTLGGSGRIAWETSLGLLKSGHDVHLLTAAPAGAFKDMEDGIRMHRIPRRGQRFAQYRSVFSRTVECEVLRIIDDVQPDIIHAHGVAWQIGYRWIRSVREQKIPVIFTAHGTMHIAYGKVFGNEKFLWLRDLKRAQWTFNPFRNIFVRSALKRCSVLLAVSDALRDYMRQHGYPDTQTLHNGIDLDFWREQSSMKDARNALHLPQDATIFLIAGRLGHDKGADVIALSLPSDTHLIVAGEVPKDAFSHIKDRMHLFVHQSAEQMRQLYAACDAAVVPSVYLDPFPTVCLEAMACKRPVVATNHGGAKESVIDGKTGWIVDPADTGKLRQVLQWCAGHRMELPHYGQAARIHMEKEFPIDLYLSTLLAIYEDARRDS